MEPVVQQSEAEKDERRGQYGDQHREDQFHRNVSLGAFGGFGSGASAAQFGDGQPERLPDNVRRADDADDPCHCNPTDPNMPGIIFKNHFGRHVAQQRGDPFAHGEGLPVGEVAEKRDQYEPYGERSGANIGRIPQAHDVAETEDGGAGVDLENDFHLVGQRFAPAGHAGRYFFGPPAESTDDKVVDSSDESAGGEQFGLVSLFFAGDEHFGRGSGFGEREFTVHVAHEIFAERDQQQDAEHTAEQRRQEDLVELRFEPQNVESGQREDGSGDDDPGTCADRLDNDVLSEHVAAAGEVADADGDDGDRDGGFEDLTDAQTEVRGGGGEDDGHQDAECDRVRGYFARCGRVGHDGAVGFAGGEFAVCVFGQRGSIGFVRLCHGFRVSVIQR